MHFWGWLLVLSAPISAAWTLSDSPREKPWGSWAAFVVGTLALLVDHWRHKRNTPPSRSRR